MTACLHVDDARWLSKALSTGLRGALPTRDVSRRCASALTHLHTCDACLALWKKQAGGGDETRGEDGATPIEKETEFLLQEIDAEIAARRASLSRSTDGPPLVALPPQPALSPPEDATDLRAATFARLTERRRQILELLCTEDLTDSAIAARIGSTPNAVRQQRFQALRLAARSIFDDLGMDTETSAFLAEYYDEPLIRHVPAAELVSRAEARAAGAAGLLVAEVRDRHLRAMRTCSGGARQLGLHRLKTTWKPIVELYGFKAAGAPRPSPHDDPYGVRTEFVAMAEILRLCQKGRSASLAPAPVRRRPAATKQRPDS